MKRFIYILESTEPGCVCVVTDTLNAFEQLVEGAPHHYNYIQSDVRLPKTQLDQFGQQHQVRIQMHDRIAQRGHYLLSVADTYPSIGMETLQRMMGESLA